MVGHAAKPANRAGAAMALAVAALCSAGCTSLDTLSEAEIRDIRADIEIPEDAGGPDAEPDADAPIFESDLLCEYPPTPPRVPAAAEDERPCSNSNRKWPNCLPDECNGNDFETACQQFCQMNCEREDWFCDRTHCRRPEGDGTYCDTEAARQECVELCGDDVACLQAACEDRQKAECAGFDCADDGENLCGGQTCDNSCETAFDGVCDDGSPINASGDDCAIGSDCADCGAREDECFPLGAECFATVQCCGFEDGSAYCVGVADDPELGPLGRCVAACPQSKCNDPNASPCGEGFDCACLQDGGGACFPFCSSTL